MANLDVLVVGGGAMGLATAWRLARRGREVLVVEQDGIGGLAGASHGGRRNFNPHFPHEPHLGLLRPAFDAYRELEAESGRTLLPGTGIVSHGAGLPAELVVRRMRESGLAGRDLGIEVLGADEAERRWPGIRFDGTVLHTPEAGGIRADETLLALAESAVRRGAEIRLGVRAEIERVEDEGAEVVLESAGTGARQRVRARTLVVAAGAWTAAALGKHIGLPRLRVTEENPVHFPRYDAGLDWPSFNHWAGLEDPRYREDYWHPVLYGMLTPGEGVKAGWHAVGAETDPATREFLVDERVVDHLRRYAEDWLPGVDASRVEAVACTYTTAPDGLFILDRVGPVVVLAGFAGEGFKFAPLIGRIGADLAEGGPGPEAFSLSRPGLRT